NCCTECPDPGKSCVCDDSEGAWLQGRLAKYATAIFSMGDMIHYTPGSRNDLFYWPIDLDSDNGERYRRYYPEVKSNVPIRVVHATNHRGFKGTHFLIEIVERLQTEGLAIELVLVERVPNRQALKIYRTADIIFDQCLVGFHGYFALEAMAIGKPVMVFIRNPAAYLVNAEECPFANTPLGQLETNLRLLVSNRPKLKDLGERGRQYIEKYHSLPAYAERLQRAYDDLSCKARGRTKAGKLNRKKAIGSGIVVRPAGERFAQEAA